MIVFMKTKRTPAQRRKEFETFARQLASIDWISEGYVQNRGPGAGGPRFQWTRKVRGKTVSVALSEIQFEALDKAIQNWRLIQNLLKRMQRLSREEIFTQLPGTTRRKSLSKKVSGLI
jgi:L-2-hydroxyglutarate oxidase LhgO